MLITGHHRLSADEHHAAAKARRKRIAKGKEAIEIRQSMAHSLGQHPHYNPTEKGKIWE